MRLSHLLAASRRGMVTAPARRAAAVTIAVNTLALLIAACGASKPPGSPRATTKPTSPAVAFTRCMRSHGVSDYPDPTARNSSPGTNGLPKVNLRALGVSSSQVDAAERTCQRLLPNGAQVSRPTSRSILSSLTDFARCMRSHGVSDWPDASRTLGNFPGSPRFGFDLAGIPDLEAGASGSFVPRINALIGRCLRRQHLASVQVPWGAWTR